jgi:hypothetical protein
VTQPGTPPAPASVSTAGAWLGVGIGARSALGAVTHFVPLVVAAGTPLIVDLIDRSARAQEVPPEIMRVTELWLELATIVGPYARTAAAAGVLIGLALFVSAGFLVRGSETGRRLTRVLLVAQAAHSVAATAWAASILLGPMADWTRRYAAAMSELQDALPGIEEQFPAAFVGSGWPSVAACALVCVLSLGIDAVLFWLAGRTNARAWCAARARRRPAATAAATVSQG